MGDRGGTYRVLVWKPEGKSHLVDLGMDGSIILKWIYKKLEGGSMAWSDLAQDRDS